ncbi:MAG: hypothetical protein ACFFCS_01810 [Candidatus Hodarchaeota archaeon]
MGSKIQPILTPSLTTVQKLSGKAVAIDACTWLHQFLKVNVHSKQGNERLVLQDKTCRTINHLRGFLYRTIYLLENDVWPVFVFDGVKSKKIRRGNGSECSLHGEHERIIKFYKDAMANEMFSLAKKIGKQMTFIYPIAIAETKRLLRYIGMPVVEAPGEGEAQCNQLLQKKLVDAAVTQDADALLFGSTIVIKNLAVKNNPEKRRRSEGTVLFESSNIEKYALHKILGELGITKEQLVDIGILVGTDFNQGIHGIGPKTALKLVKEHGYIEDIATHVEKYHYSSLGIDKPRRRPFSKELDELRDVFLKPVVDESIKNLSWNTTNETKVRQLLLEDHSFSDGLVKKALHRIEKATT